MSEIDLAAAMTQPATGNVQAIDRERLAHVPGIRQTSVYATLLQEMEDWADEQSESDPEIFIFSFAPDPERTEFPRLISQKNKLRMSREELEDEIILLIEMGADTESSSAPELYGLSVLSPCPYSISPDRIPENMPNSAESNFRAGYLIHSDLNKIRSNPAQLHDLVSAYLSSSDIVEVKVRRDLAGGWRRISVELS